MFDGDLTGHVCRWFWADQDIDSAFPQRFERSWEQAARQPDIDVRVRLPEQRESTRHDPHGGKRRDAYVYRPDLLTAQLSDLFIEAVDFGCYRPGAQQDALADLGRFDATRRTREDRDAKFIFRLPEGLRQSWL